MSALETNKHHALSNLKIVRDAEIYPDEQPKHFDVNFNTNSTFVTFTHLMRAMLGPTILAVPRGFKLGGLAFSIPGFIALLVLATYNMRRLVLDAAFLSQRESVAVRTYDELAFLAFKTCSPKTARFAKPLKISINILFFVTYLDACVIFMIFIASNVQALIDFYFPETFLGVRCFIFFQVILMMSMSSLRELKQLSPFSLMASILLITAIFLLIGLVFTKDTGPIERRTMIGSVVSIFHLFCIGLFCLSGISIALTLKSSMRNPQHFFSFPGIYYISAVVAGVVFNSFGFLGYLKYGEETHGSILLNVPCGEIFYIFMKLIAIFGVLFTSPLVFYVAFNVLWKNFLKPLFSEFNVIFVEFFFRYILIIFCFLIAIAFPNLEKMIVLKGAIFHSHLEVTIPPILDYVVNYPEKGSGKYHCNLVTMVFMSLIGVTLFLGGIICSIVDWQVE